MNATGDTEAGHSSPIMYTQLVAAFMIENISSLSPCGGFLLLLSRHGHKMNEDPEQGGVWN